MRRLCAALRERASGSDSCTHSAAFFAVPGTERDPEWLERVRAAVPDLGSEVIVACERGGSLETRPGTQYGFSSRSLKALHFLRQAGYRNVSHLRGGVCAYPSALAGNCAL